MRRKVGMSVCQKLTFKGELAEDSLEVPPSYMPAFMTPAHIYD